MGPAGSGNGVAGSGERRWFHQRETGIRGLGGTFDLSDIFLDGTEGITGRFNLRDQFSDVDIGHCLIGFF